MDGDERARADEDDEAEWDEARRPPLDAYSWVIFFLLAAIVACLVLLSYAVITLRADQARGPTPVPPEDVGNVVLEAEGGPGLSLSRRSRSEAVDEDGGPTRVGSRVMTSFGRRPV